MADFYQTGMVATLHRLKPNGTARLEKDLNDLSRRTGIALVLPALYREFESPAMRKIVDELAQIHYLRRIVIVLGGATQAQYEKAQAFLSEFQCPVTILWIESKPIQYLFEVLEGKNLSTGKDGKGRSCWMAYGYVLAMGALCAEELQEDVVMAIIIL